MKHKLLSLIALAGAMFMSTGAFAQWTEPVEPTKPTAAGEFAVDKNFFIRNVGAGQYVTAGNSWSTQLSLTADGLDDTLNPAAIVTVSEGSAELSGNDNTATVSGYKLKLNGTFHFNGASGDRAITNTFLFRDSEESGFIDLGSQTKGYIWNITKVGTYYRIQTADGDPTFPNATTQYAGWVSDGMTIEEGAPTVIVFNLTAEDENIDWEFIPCDDYLTKKEAYASRVELYETLVSTTSLGYTVDTSAATAVYNNENATKEQIEAAISKLKYDINSKKYEAAWASASENNPLDVTEDCLTNPTFDTDINGWTITVTGQNLQWQNRTDGSVDESKNWVSISKFIEAWRPSDQGGLGDGTISQTVYGLPAGKYMLECDAMATRQGGLDGLSAEDAVEGAYIFIQGENHEVREPIKAPDTQPKHWSVVFINDDSQWLTFGLKVESTTANWISADNFKLTYYGKTEDSPELAILKEAIKRANELAEQVEMNNIEATDNINVSEEARQALNSAISQGESAASGSDAAAQTAATEVLNNAITAVNESKAVYAQFKAVYETGNETLNHLIDNNQWGDLQGEIETFLEDDLKAKFEAGTLTAEQLEEYQNKISDMIHEFISDPSQIHEGDDLTFLLANPHFKTGTTADPTGWTINSGSMTELALATHNIETYHKQFDLSQTIPNMPAGVYDVTLQGFARHDGGDTDKTWLYGGITKAFLISLNDDEEQMRAEPIYFDGSQEHPYIHDGNYDNTASNGMYKSNGMGGSYYWFQEINPNTNEPYYTNHVEVVLAEDGDLTIGIHCETESDWVIFDNFGIKYAGMNVAVFAKMVKDKQLELSTLVEDTEAENIMAIATDVNNLVTEKLAINADNIDNADDALAAIAEIEEVIAKVKESAAAYLSVGQVIEYFQSLLESLSPDASFADALDAAQNSYDNGYATVAAMKEDEQKLAGGWAAAMSVNIEANSDATALILNPDFDGLVPDDGVSGDQFWTSDSYHGADWLAYEHFNYQGNNLQFDTHQDLNGIKPGFYTLSVQGFYRYGDYNPNETEGTPGAGNAHAEGTEVLNAVMYVNTSATNNSVALKSIFDGAQSDAMGVNGEVQAEGTAGYIPNTMEAAAAYFNAELYPNELGFQVGEDGKCTIGIRKADGLPNDWTIISNWQLFYHGTVAPDAVQDLEAKTTGNVTIYGIDGRQQSQLRRGINIVRTNGQVNKVLVK